MSEGSANGPDIEGSATVRMLATLSVLALLTAGCAPSETAPIPDEAPGAAVDGHTQYPLTIENCGVSVRFDGPPQRAVSLYQASTEILLSLGLADQMVGTSTWFDPVFSTPARSVPRMCLPT